MTAKRFPHSPSRLIPRARHFCSLQCWQRLRLVRSMRQFLCREHEYIALFCWLRRKKPCKRKHKCIRYNKQSTTTNTWGGRCGGPPCSLHRWWRRSGSLRIYPHRFYRESLLFELEEKKHKGRSDVIVPVYIRWKYTQHHPVRSLSIPDVMPRHRLHAFPQECNK